MRYGRTCESLDGLDLIMILDQFNSFTITLLDSFFLLTTVLAPKML